MRTRETGGAVARVLAIGVVACLLCAACSTGATSPQQAATPSPATPASTAGVGTASAGVTAATTPGPIPTVAGVTVTDRAPGGRWTYNFLEPRVSGLPPDVQTAVMGSINDKISGYISAFTSRDLPMPASDAEGSTLYGGYGVPYLSSALLSVTLTTQTHIAGAAQDQETEESLNFDLSTGAVINFEDLFVDPAAALPVLDTEAHSILAAHIGSDLSWPASTTMAFFAGDWAFTKPGLMLKWPKGDLAPASYFFVTATIPWVKLKAVIDPAGPAGSFIA